MKAFLWVMVCLGVFELFCTLFYVAKRELPSRTISGATVNAAGMFALAMWAFWLLRGL